MFLLYVYGQEFRPPASLSLATLCSNVIIIIYSNTRAHPVYVHMGGRIAHTKPNQTCGRRLSLCPFQKLSDAIHFLRGLTEVALHAKRCYTDSHTRGRPVYYWMISVQGGQFVYEGRGEAAIVSLFHQNLHTFSSLRLCVCAYALTFSLDALVYRASDEK